LSRSPTSEAASDNTPRVPITIDTSDGDLLTVITWPKIIAVAKQKAFTLELKGRVLDGSLGDRGTTMVVTTALRLLDLRISEQKSKGYVALANKTH